METLVLLGWGGLATAPRMVSTNGRGKRERSKAREVPKRSPSTKDSLERGRGQNPK